MGIIVKKYRENFLQRYDPDEGIPFPGPDDFPGLICDGGSFQNSEGTEIRYRTYRYDGCRKDTTVLFCHGLGPGHTPYMADIEYLCRAGLKVLALDYTGCGMSGGERLTSVNAPVRDSAELLERLCPEEEIVPVGHSLGGYTALTLANLFPQITRAVVISGFMSISDEMMGYMKLRILADRIKRYEKKLLPRFGFMDNRAYLASTRDRILWIHSKDDPMVNYRYNAGQAAGLGNPSVRVISVENKKHMPQYTAEALETMNEWFGGYYKGVREKKLVSLEEKRAYFEDKPVRRMTEPDPAVFAEILNLIG